MTIIQPSKSSRGINLVFMGSMLALLVAASWSIVLYNSTVNVAHDIAVKEREYKALLGKNAELKNTFYALTDAKNLRRAAESAGLHAITRPEYIEPISNIALSRVVSDLPVPARPAEGAVAAALQ